MPYSGILGLVVHPDGSVERLPIFPSIQANGITSTDVVIQIPGSHSIGARVFLPGKGGKLPVVLYFHGGGFVMFSPDMYLYHGLCDKLAEYLDAVIVSVNYRLAPEHKLPAAYEDGVLALRWLGLVASGSASCPLLARHADFSRCLAMGDSAGANIIHNVLLAGDEESSDTELIKGVALLQPFFGGEKRSEQEIRLRNDRYIPLEANDILWKLALAAGWDRDCEACNPVFSGKKAAALKILVVVGGRDPMHERQLEYAKRIKAGGGDVKLVEYKTASHGFMVLNVTKPAHSQALLLLMDELKDLIRSSSGANVTSKL